MTGEAGGPPVRVGGEERFATNWARVENRDVLIPLIEDIMLRRTTEDWVHRLNAAGVPAGPIQTADQAVQDPQVIARGADIAALHARGAVE